MTLLFLYKLIDALKEYFGEVCEESIRDNFVIIYELFDEMMDFGYPQTTDPKILRKFVFTLSSLHVDILPFVSSPLHTVTFSRTDTNWRVRSRQQQFSRR